MSRHRRWVALSGGLAIVAAAAVAMPASAAHADTLPSPGSPAVSFNGWSEGNSDLTVSWTPAAGADGYEVAYMFGDNAPTSPGAGTEIPVPGGESTSTPLSVGFADGDISVSVFAYTGQPGALINLSAPASATSAVAGAPNVTATPVSGVAGHATLSWSAPPVGDTLVLRTGNDSGNGPTSGTSVPITPGQTSVEISGLPAYPSYTWVGLYELGDGQSDNWSPPTTTLAFAAPPSEGKLVAGETDNATYYAVNWLPPGTCSAPLDSCDHGVVVENPGTEVATSPSDGTVETDPGGTTADAVNVTDITPGDTYTFTLFNVATIRGTSMWSPGESETVRPLASPIVTMSASPAAPVTAGQEITITASLTTIGTTPTGTVNFFTVKHHLCDAVVVTAAETASCQTNSDVISAEPSAEPPSGFDVYADYSGDFADDLSEGDLIVVTVDKADPDLNVASKPAGHASGRVTITARVRGGAGNGTGTITMTSGGHLVCARARLSKGHATCRATKSHLGAGRHSVTVRYSGNTSYKAKVHKTEIKLGK
jgi:hypothetical protein